jgi:hypothetical protein
MALLTPLLEWAKFVFFNFSNTITQEEAYEKSVAEVLSSLKPTKTK